MNVNENLFLQLRRLRNENLFLQLMSHDVFEKVMENLHLNEDHTSELWKEFNDKFRSKRSTTTSTSTLATVRIL